MPESKTRPTDTSVQEYLTSRASPEQQADCAALMALLSRVTGQEPRMWGPSIVGYGSYEYTYDSGRKGASHLVGFAIRSKEIVVYLAPNWEDAQALLTHLGKHKTGKGCLYFKRLADLDEVVLEQLVVGSVAELVRRHGKAGNSPG